MTTMTPAMHAVILARRKCRYDALTGSKATLRQNLRALNDALAVAADDIADLLEATVVAEAGLSMGQEVKVGVQRGTVSGGSQHGIFIDLADGGIWAYHPSDIKA